jgi:hypothetical protein
VLLLIALALTKSVESQTLRVATIGDFGWAGSNEAKVASMISGWNVEDILALGGEQDARARDACSERKEYL